MNNRLLLAAALGALAFASACDGQGSGDKAVEPGKILTLDPSEVQHGDLPEKRTDNYPFNPVHDVLVFIRFNADGSHTARVHYFAAGAPLSASEMATKMAPAVAALNANIDAQPANSLNKPSEKLRNLNNFDFSGQSNVLTVIANQKISFRQEGLFFSKRLKNNYNNYNSDENKAFYDANPIEVRSGANKWSALFFRNYFTKGNEGTGNPGTEPIKIGETKHYSFNFNLTSASTDPGSGEQFIFDPDGGNMGSGGPPP